MSYDEKDALLEYKFERQIKNILGNFFIKKDITHDLKEGTDFAIFGIKPFKVAVRLRRNYCLDRGYGKEFTIRWSRPSGAKTEINKIEEGLVDYILYGFLDKDETKLVQYFIGDLAVFRDHLQEPFKIKKNKSGDSELAIYKWSQFPASFFKEIYPPSTRSTL
jgi:hypothetical protein